MSEFQPKPSILVVEDEPTNALIARMICQKFGCEVEDARNGLEALGWLGRRRFDVALVDVQMPVMDGLSFAQAVRMHPEWRRMALVAVTARASARDREAIHAAGIEAIVTKPYHNATLRDAITEALARSRAH
jgi:CheY-like chemotaxis protein